MGLAAGGPCLSPGFLLSDTVAASSWGRGSGSALAPRSSHINRPPGRQLTAHSPSSPARPAATLPACPLPWACLPAPLAGPQTDGAVFQVNIP